MRHASFIHRPPILRRRGEITTHHVTARSITDLEEERRAARAEPLHLLRTMTSLGRLRTLRKSDEPHVRSRPSASTAIRSARMSAWKRDGVPRKEWAAYPLAPHVTVERTAIRLAGMGVCPPRPSSETSVAVALRVRDRPTRYARPATANPRYSDVAGQRPPNPSRATHAPLRPHDRTDLVHEVRRKRRKKRRKKKKQTSSMKCVVSSTTRPPRPNARPPRLYRRSSSHVARRECGSIPLVGSSSSAKRGAPTSAHATQSLRFIPPESAAARACALGASPTAPSAAAAAVARASPRSPSRRRENRPRPLSRRETRRACTQHTSFVTRRERRDKSDSDDVFVVKRPRSYATRHD